MEDCFALTLFCEWPRSGHFVCSCDEVFNACKHLIFLLFLEFVMCCQFQKWIQTVQMNIHEYSFLNFLLHNLFCSFNTCNKIASDINFVNTFALICALQIKRLQRYRGIKVWIIVNITVGNIKVNLLDTRVLFKRWSSGTKTRNHRFHRYFYIYFLQSWRFWS